MSRTVTSREANHKFSELLAEAEAGRPVTITKRGRAVAKLVPYHPAADEKRQEAKKRLMEFLRQGLDLGGYKFNRKDCYDDR